MGKKNGPLTKGLSSWIDEVKTLSLLLLNEPAPRNEFMVSTHATTNDTKCLEIQKKKYQFIFISSSSHFHYQ